MKAVVIYRVLAGIIISISVGLIMHFCTSKDECILKNSEDIIECDCGFCNDNYEYNKSKLDKQIYSINYNIVNLVLKFI